MRGRSMGGLVRAGSLLFTLAALCASWGCSKDGGRPSAPVREGRVNDFAGALSPSTVAELSSLLEGYEEETCHQVVVAVFPSLKGESISALSSRMAESWEIGHPQLENGLLLTIALQEGEARMDAGGALEELIAGGRGESILREDMFPSFREDRIGEGISRGLAAIMEEGRKAVIPPDLRPPVCRGGASSPKD